MVEKRDFKICCLTLEIYSSNFWSDTRLPSYTNHHFMPSSQCRRVAWGQLSVLDPASRMAKRWKAAVSAWAVGNSRAVGRLLWVSEAEVSFFLVAPKPVHAGARLSSAVCTVARFCWSVLSRRSRVHRPSGSWHYLKHWKALSRGDWGARDYLLSKSHRSVLRDDGSGRIHPLPGKPAAHQCVQWLPLDQRAERPILDLCL